MEETMKATFISERTSGAGAKQKLYRLDPPMPYDRYDDEEDKRTHHADYVIVSAVIAMFSGPETYIFPADSDGTVKTWGELDGSYRGGLDHEEALRRAGYEVSAEEH
jgi:hypothetical protein